MLEKIEPIIHPQTMTTGPPVVSPYGKRRVIPLITATAVKQKLKFINALNPLCSSALYPSFARILSSSLSFILTEEKVCISADDYLMSSDAGVFMWSNVAADII